MKPFLGEVLVELFLTHIDAPGFAVDDHADHIGLGHRNVFACHQREEDRADEGRILVGVEQIEGAITAHVLSLFGEIERDIERTFLAFAHHEIGGHSAEMHADLRIHLAIDRQFGGDVHIGFVEFGQLLFPVGIFKFEEEGAESFDVIEGFLRKGPGFGHGHFGTGFGSGGVATTAEGRTPTAARPTAPTAFCDFLREKCAGFLTFRKIQPAVAVVVKLVHDLGDGLNPAHAAGTSGATSSTGSPAWSSKPGPAWRAIVARRCLRDEESSGRQSKRQPKKEESAFHKSGERVVNLGCD